MNANEEDKLIKFLEKLENELDELKENHQQLHRDYSAQKINTEHLLMTLQETIKRQDELFSVIYKGSYGRNSLFEEVQIASEKIVALDNQLSTAKRDISSLEDRWVKFLWTVAFTVGGSILMLIFTLLQEEANSKKEINLDKAPPQERSEKDKKYETPSERL